MNYILIAIIGALSMGILAVWGQSRGIRIAARCLTAFWLTFLTYQLIKG